MFISKNKNNAHLIHIHLKQDLGAELWLNAPEA